MTEFSRRSLLSSALHALPLAAMATSLGGGLLGNGLLASPAAAAVDAAAINSWFMNLRNVKGRFAQVNPNGSQQTGTYYLSRPGKMRFDYDNPKGAMVISDGGTVAVFDPKSSRPTRYPLGMTPLALFLDTRTSLADRGIVLGATEDRRGVHIVTQDPRNPKLGRVTLTFGTRPLTLKRWLVETGRGNTEVTLLSLEPVRDFPSGTFNIEGTARANAPRN